PPPWSRFRVHGDAQRVTSVYSHASGSERRDAGGLRALLALAHLEAHALVLVQAAEAAGVDLRVVDEHVRAAVIGGDEAEALFGVEPLHGAFSHSDSSYSVDQNAACRRSGPSSCGGSRLILQR